METQKEGFFKKTGGRIASLLVDNVDFVATLAVWAVLVSFYSANVQNLNKETIYQVSGGLILVTIGVAAFFGNKPSIWKKLASKNTWVFAGFIPALSAGLTIVAGLFDYRTVMLFLFLYAIFSTLGVSYAVINAATDSD